MGVTVKGVEADTRLRVAGTQIDVSLVRFLMLSSAVVLCVCVCARGVCVRAVCPLCVCVCVWSGGCPSRLS